MAKKRHCPKTSKIFLAFVKQGTPLSSSELAEAEEIVQEVKRKSGVAAKMCELGVMWLIGNPMPLKLPAVK